MFRLLLEKFKESAQAILPISGIVLLMQITTLASMPMWTFLMFVLGTFLLILGMSIFTLGADLAMMPIGEAIGAEITKSRKLWLIIISGFIIGVVVTIAEPDLQVLTKQVPSVPDAVLVGSVAVGVGLFLVIALLRILLQVPIKYILLISYAIVFILAAFSSPDYIGVAFDSGGVTTGPITVPFILAMGAGVSAVRGGKSTEEDSFGLCGLSSIGPIMAVLLLGIFYEPGSGHAYTAVESVDNAAEFFKVYGEGFLQFFEEVSLVLLPIVTIFILFQVVKLKMPRTRLIRIFIGIIYTLVGLTIFLTGANIGFMQAGTFIGKALAENHRWMLLPLSAVLGFFVVYAEPAVHVLNKQVEEITSGAISKKMMMAGLSMGVSLAMVISVVRILADINILWFLVPIYGVALLLTFVTPKVFVSIAYDSGGVAAGTMTAAFILPFAIGITEAVGGNIMTDAFGIIAMVAMFPLVTIQILGIIYNQKLKRSKQLEKAHAIEYNFVSVPQSEAEDNSIESTVEKDIQIAADRVDDATVSADDFAKESGEGQTENAQTEVDAEILDDKTAEKTENAEKAKTNDAADNAENLKAATAETTDTAQNDESTAVAEKAENSSSIKDIELSDSKVLPEIQTAESANDNDADQVQIQTDDGNRHQDV